MLKTKSTKKSKWKSKQQDSSEAPVPSLKERIAQKKKADRLRKEIINFTIFAAFFAAIIGLIVGLAGGWKVGVGSGVGILYTSLSFKYPRHALWAFLIYLPFGGTITYYIGNSPLLQLAKDGFYIPALFGVIQYCRRENLPLLIPKRLVTPLAILLVLCLFTLTFVNGMQQFSAATGPLEGTLYAADEGILYEDADISAGGSPFLMGVLGLKVLIGYIPLIVCAYYLIRNKSDLLFLSRLTVVLILTCCGLAFVQYLFLKTGRCEGTRFAEGSSLFRASLDAKCFVGGSLLYSPEHGQIRLPGTFVAPWQWGWFLISAGFFGFASAFSDPFARWRTMGLLSMAAVFVMSVLSGQRVALGLVPVSIMVLLVLTGQIVNLKRFLPAAFILAILLGIASVNNPAIVQERVDSFWGRWEASPPQEFIVSQFEWALGVQEGILGKGLGRATNSARVFGDTAFFETYYPKLLYEIGPLGTLAFLAVVTVLTIETFRAYRSVKERNLKSFGASYWVFVLLISYNTYYYPLDVDPVAVYYWFFAGVVLKLPELDRQEKLAAQGIEEPVGRKRKRLKRAGFS
ncbi:hypothetical protein H6F95_21900 [Cyanobacteria bacterium FACHB-471]|nr:hypothetical protein [Cyanobacteria bacterium FACHB-471]